MTGVIKYKKDAGFGFIGPDDGGPDVFFHRSALRGISFENLREGARVRYEMEQSEKGPRAGTVETAA